MSVMLSGRSRFLIWIGLMLNSRHIWILSKVHIVNITTPTVSLSEELSYRRDVERITRRFPGVPTVVRTSTECREFVDFEPRIVRVRSRRINMVVVWWVHRCIDFCRAVRRIILLGPTILTLGLPTRRHFLTKYAHNRRKNE